MKTTLCIFLLFLGTVHNWRVFHHGRRVGGNLGKPSRDLLQNLPPNQWFTQNLDHFDPVNRNTWQQRYFVNDTFFNRNGPSVVFLMIGGEGEASPEWMVQGAWIEYAAKYQALCFQLEHRYYGKSHPTIDLSTKNLQYLTSQQALADLATFIAAMNVKYELPPDTKWIAFGGSYPGSLAAWLRLKYPHLVFASVSTSGPLLAQLDFSEYFHVVNDDVEDVSMDCLEAIEEGTVQVELLMQHMVGQRSLNQLFRLCDPVEQSVKNPLDISNLFESLAGNFANIAQYNKDNRIGTSKTKNITLDTLCGIMVDESIGKQVNRLAAVNDLLLNATNQTCLDYKYENMINEMGNDSFTSEVSEGGRQWMYQTCTEFGFYQTSNYKPQMFSDKFPLDFFVQQCVDIFGPRYNRAFIESAIRRTNVLYGGLSIQVDNVLFVHGSVDPWHALGITNSTKKSTPAIYIAGTAHCANMYPSSEDDLPALTDAREKIKETIGKWLDL